MTRGILYFTFGQRCLIRLLVSLHSLRRHYQGPVTIAAEGSQPDWFVEMAKELKAEFIEAPASNEYGLLKKSRLWRIMPYDVTLFLDADTLIRAPVEELIEKTEKHGCLVTRFHDWKSTGRRMRGRIKQWSIVDRKAVDAALAYGWAINTGIQGWTRGSAILPEYERLTAAGLAHREIGKKTLDEIAMQLLVATHPHYLAGSEWNFGPIYGDPKDAKILHYHGHKHCRKGSVACDMWKAEFWELVKRFPKHASQLIGETMDRSICRWLKEEFGFGQRKDLTIVTAVNPKYAVAAKKNIALWMQTPGLREQKFIIFVNGFKNAAERSFLDYPNVTVIRWNYPFAVSEREKMLAAFILGVSEHVKTDYWMKLDCDAHPVKPYFVWPDYRKRTITSSKWHYTKCKCDDELKSKGHWFNRLDKVFSPDSPAFPPLDIKADFKVSHRRGNKLGIPMRFGSFCHIEKTSFTKRMADVIRARCGGRLPIPSQDTTSWYCAYLWKEKFKVVNMREQMQP